MDEACTCTATRRSRDATAERLGIKYRKQWEIRRGLPDSPEGESVVSISFLIALAVMLVLFVGSIIIASRTGGVVSILGIIAAVATGIYLAWTAVLVVFARFIVAILKKIG